MEAWNPTIRDEEGPKYLAIVRILAEDIRSGRLPPGTRLPPQRSLAKHLNVDLTTVTRAFNEARRGGSDRCVRRAGKLHSRRLAVAGEGRDRRPVRQRRFQHEHAAPAGGGPARGAYGERSVAAFRVGGVPRPDAVPGTAPETSRIAPPGRIGSAAVWGRCGPACHRRRRGAGVARRDPHRVAETRRCPLRPDPDLSGAPHGGRAAWGSSASRVSRWRGYPPGRVPRMLSSPPSARPLSGTDPRQPDHGNDPDASTRKDRRDRPNPRSRNHRG